MVRFRLLAVFVLALTAPAYAGAMSSGSVNSLRQLEKPTCAKGDPVVWLNHAGTVFFPESSPWYGKTRGGSWSCATDAVRGGAHAALAASPSPGPAASGAPASPAPSP